MQNDQPNLIQHEKEVRLSYNHPRRSYVSVVREHYLREDISCRSELCVLCPDYPSHSKSKGVSLKAWAGLVFNIPLVEVHLHR